MALTSSPVLPCKVCGLPSHAKARATSTATRAAGRDCDVAIIGAGPAGLTAAIALKQAVPDISVRVFDKATSFRPAGSVINLGVNAMKAYSAIDPSGGVSASLRAARAPASSHMAVWAIDGQEVRKMSGSELDRANMEKFGETSQRMTWYDFQTALRSHVPDGTVHINHHLDQFTQDASGVTVSFNGGETVVRCGILLGADGVYSQIRRQLTASSEQLEGTNRVLFRATSTVDEWEGPVDAFMGADEFLVYTLGGPAGSCMHSVFNELLTFAAVFPNEVCERSGISVLYDDKELRAHLATKDGSLDTKSGDPNAVKEILLRLLGPFHDKARGIVEGMRPERVMVHNDWICVDPAKAVWNRGRVALLGDSMHSMGVTGVGIGLAVEDALVLAHHIGEKGLVSDALDAYVAERRPRIKVVYDKLLDLRRQAGAPTPNSTNFLNKASTQGPGAPQGPPQPHAAQQGNGAGAPQGPPPGKVPPGQQYQMFETWANGYLAEQDWKALAPAAQLAETAA